MAGSLRSILDAPESMLKRWQESPPDEEPAELSAIKSAIALSQKSKIIPSLAHRYSRHIKPEDYAMIVIENIPLSMAMDQFVQIMLLKDIKRPHTFQYQFEYGTFGGLAFAEFKSNEDANFAISRLHRILLEGHTLLAYLESPEPKFDEHGLAADFQD